jgi:hypothetical protein
MQGTVEPRSFLTSEAPKVVLTGADTASPATIEQADDDQFRESWQALIDHRLIEWGRDPRQLDEEGTKVPSKDTIQRAIWLADRLCKNGLPAPTNIVPDAHGGIVFERKCGEMFESVRVMPDGTAEYCAFKDCHWALERVPLMGASKDTSR